MAYLDDVPMTGEWVKQDPAFQGKKSLTPGELKAAGYQELSVPMPFYSPGPDSHGSRENERQMGLIAEAFKIQKQVQAACDRALFVFRRRDDFLHRTYVKGEIPQSQEKAA